VETLLLPYIPICGRVLDVCCGTGQLASELHSRGYQVAGLDRSREMLLHARRRMPGVSWLQADARRFAVHHAFHAATCLFDSVNHMLDPDDVCRTFSSIRGALRPDGLFLFDVNTDLGFRERWVREWEVVTEDGVCRLAGEYDPRTRTGSYRFTLKGRGPEAWRCADFTFRERCHSDAELRSSLARAGFDVLEVCDAVEDLGLEEEVGRSFYVATAR
jgi:SAM-dependent methyltransferase